MLRTGWYTPVDPPPVLVHLLLCAWTAVPTGRHLLVPDACCELLWLSTGRLVFCGPETSAWEFELPSGTTAVGVRFRPGVPTVLFGLDTAQFREVRVDAREVLGPRRAEEWIATIRAAATLDARRDTLAGLVGADCGQADPDPFAEAVLDRLVRRPDDDVAAHAAALGVTGRTLHRRCLRLFGHGPATVARLLRLQRFLAIAATSEHPVLADMAVAAGYVDQAHLTRECRRVTGHTPVSFLRQYFATFPDMSDPYKSGADFA